MNLNRREKYRYFCLAYQVFNNPKENWPDENDESILSEIISTSTFLSIICMHELDLLRIEFLISRVNIDLLIFF